MKKAALIILDGWGIGAKDDSDGIYLANTPNFDHYLTTYSHARLKTFGEHVGLPEGQMGNSEVGHLNIGAGRIVYQDFARINQEVKTDGLERNTVLASAINQTEISGKSFHLMGLIGYGGVHASQAHLHALIDILEKSKIEKIYIHAFTDGRDADPKGAIENITELTSFIEGKKAKLVSMIGRYYAMDRDKRWPRIKKAYDLLINGDGEKTNDFIKACEQSYAKGITDEFFEPVLSENDLGRIESGDTVLCYNFRTDRCRQITTALTQTDLNEFGMARLNLRYITMTKYDETFKNIFVMYDKVNLAMTLGEVVSLSGGSQLRIAETEKYPHVTFFFSGGREKVFKLEERITIASPKVATYDLLPEMSAVEVAENCVKAIAHKQPDFVCLNFANADMVGHTGVSESIIKAVETVDQCLKLVVDVALVHEYEIIVIADHGNADQMINADGSPNTAHTTNLVPCIFISNMDGRCLKDGILADVAPTILDIMRIDKPHEMTGESLLQ